MEREVERRIGRGETGIGQELGEKADRGTETVGMEGRERMIWRGEKGIG